jgi:hypothetical protein
MNHYVESENFGMHRSNQNSNSSLDLAYSAGSGKDILFNLIIN